MNRSGVMYASHIEIWRILDICWNRLDNLRKIVFRRYTHGWNRQVWKIDFLDRMHCMQEFMNKLNSSHCPLEANVKCVTELPRALKLFDPDVLMLHLYHNFNILGIAFKIPPENRWLYIHIAIHLEGKTCYFVSISLDTYYYVGVYAMQLIEFHLGSCLVN